ncbi:hypothetical protein ACFO25_01705 [Paenactinomyces guangxiensis]|uniref:Protein kinase domain-containing protein n=1 Tax=Paenactinomyces guangxiensis TaxID=1490290 RepID=A0A7W2A9J2_9BACL|nr:hypothetical protein [Paenactinomyces guangxiensis]MBA4494943.1 hypothetical protein [Paenactinomyces guangxiensis]MBH8592026.1 hypothetical protein [Paenactinomyces guangxiensis]
MEIQKKYYEHFQVEDVLTFSRGSLLLARSPEGTQVLLHELKSKDLLPVNCKESLRKLKHPHLVPVWDIYEDGQSAVVVHPIVSGEPLTLLVTPEKPMPYQSAIYLYRQLLQTVKDLTELPLPILTTLDPRNIVMDGKHPYLLFFDISSPGRKVQQDEEWRSLLYYLITGTRFDEKRYPLVSEIKLDFDIPRPVQNLIKESLNPRRSLNDILQLAKNTDIPVSQKRKEFHPLMVPTAVSAAIISILVAGYFVMSSDVINSGEAITPAQQSSSDQTGVFEQIPALTFKGDDLSSQLTKETIRGVTHIQFQITQDRHAPFTAYFLSEETSYQYGIGIDSTAELRVVGEQQEQVYGKPSERRTKYINLDTNRTYQVDMYYIPNERLRISVRELNKKAQWVTVGPVMKDENYRFRFRGNKRTQVSQVVLSHYENSQEAINKWQEGRPWDLVDGEVQMDEKGMWIQPGSQWQMTKPGYFSFVFSYTSLPPKNPIQVNLETAEATQFKFIWRKNNVLEFIRVDDQKTTATKKVPWDWNSKLPATIKIYNEYTLIKIEIEQGNERESLIYHHDYPILVKKGTIPIQEEMYVEIPQES